MASRSRKTENVCHYKMYNTMSFVLFSYILITFNNLINNWIFDYIWLIQTQRIGSC